MVQDLLGCVWKPLGRTDWTPASLFASLLFIGAWGWFLFQGVIDPTGGINSLWPIFGIANQLLAVIALSLGVTVLIKMQRVRYVWVPALPLAWLLAVTVSAGWIKIFSASPRLGFLAAADAFRAKIAAGGDAAQLAAWRVQVFNNQVDAVLTGIFLVLVGLVLIASARVWWKLLAGQTKPVLHEEPYVAVSALEESCGEPTLS